MIGTYPTTGSVVLAEDADTNPIFKIELDEAIDEDLEVDLSFLGSAIFGGNYTVATQAPVAPAGTVLPANTSTCYFVYPDSSGLPVPNGMMPCGSVVIPKGKTYVEVQVVQAITAPRPTGNSIIEIELMSSDRYEIDRDTAMATISPRVGRYTYTTTFANQASPACPPANPGYTFTSQSSSSQTTRSAGADFSSKTLTTYSNDPIGYILRTVDNSTVYTSEVTNAIKIGNSWYTWLQVTNTGSSLTQAQQIAAFGAPTNILVVSSGSCSYTEI